MTRHIAIAASILTLSASASFAQNAAPATPGTAARPAVTAPAATPSAIPAPSGSVARNVARSAQEARTVATANASAKEATCKAKGPLFKYRPPHAIGDSDGKGGFYTTNFGGSCRSIVTGSQMQAMREAGLLKN